MITILMPCLNEEANIKYTIEKAFKFLNDNKIKGEVLIADNGSTDNSVKIALKLGARVINVKKKGYGNALKEGIKKAKGDFIIMGDSDSTYDFYTLKEFYDKNYDLIIGNRFKGKIEKGATPFINRYIGNPILSSIGNLLYHGKNYDFHCGLRSGFKDKILALNLETEGMEFASEMIIKALKSNYKIKEVPITLYKCQNKRKSSIRPLRDGMKHLKIMLKLLIK